MFEVAFAEQFEGRMFSSFFPSLIMKWTLLKMPQDAHHDAQHMELQTELSRWHKQVKCTASTTTLAASTRNLKNIKDKRGDQK